MTIALLVVTDGRLDYLEQCIASAEQNLYGSISERWMYDDTGDDEHRRWLCGRFPQFIHVDDGPRQGFGGAINAAWRQLVACSVASYVFHVEQDFTFNRPVDLDAMTYVLDTHKHLIQLALRRQPWNPAEHAAGGVIEQYPDDYTECTDGEYQWLEHRRFFTTNPSLYRWQLMTRGWPDGEQSEGRFGFRLMTEDGFARFGFWGRREDPPAVHHIGQERVGHGY